ncbi:MAG TPA: hypothetical protein VM165_06320, partial [Planctomycetaceae bacterium]|nr:hypothetical protein [Planctomycetaceae bacterium]
MDHFRRRIMRQYGDGGPVERGKRGGRFASRASTRPKGQTFCRTNVGVTISLIAIQSDLVPMTFVEHRRSAK